MYHTDQAISRLIGSTHELLSRRLQANLEANSVPLTAEQFQIMCWLWDKDGINQQQLASAMRRNRGSVTRILDVLERKGLVSRKCDDADRRVNKVCLTDEGVRWRDEARRLAMETLNTALNGLQESELEAASKALRKMIVNLEA